jgi:glycosyltransferase involved in cell wall biosynthesis
MKIVIDMQGAQTESRFRGIGRYTIAFAKSLVLNAPQHDVILVCNGLFPESIEVIRHEFSGILKKENIVTWFAPYPINSSDESNAWRRRASQLIFQNFIDALTPDIFIISSLFEGYSDNAVTTADNHSKKYISSAIIYDLIPLVHQNHYFRSDIGYQDFYMQQLKEFSNLDILLAISEHSLKEAVDLLHIPSEKLKCINGAADSVFEKISIHREQKKELFDRFGIANKFILYTGGADIRKNLKRLICGYSALPEPIKAECQLVLAGKMPEGVLDELRAVANECALTENQILFTGYVSENDLLCLYNLCDLYVFPSWHEGFGLPVLEAMTCGAPVICSNNTSVYEVCGRYDATFNPLVEGEITAKLYEVLSNETFRNELIQYSLERSKLFSWDCVARSALDFFEAKYLKLKSTRHRQSGDSSELSALYDGITNLNGYASEQDLIGMAASIALNDFSFSRKPCLFVDVSELYARDAKTGIQRVTRSILLELVTNPPEGFDVYPVFARPDEVGYRYATKLLNDITAKNCPQSNAFIDTKKGDIFLGLDLQHQVVGSQEKYLQTLRNQGVGIYFVVYDLLPILRPRDFADGAAQMHSEWLSILCKFDGLSCISKAVADEFRMWSSDFAKLTKDFRVGYFHLGSDIHNSIPSAGKPADADAVIAKIKATTSFLMVGTLEPRKGYQQVLEAFELIWGAGGEASLVMVGKLGWKTEALAEKIKNHPQLEKKLFWLQGISDEYLDEIYNASSCLIAASYGEGFGLPLVEASAHGIPIIARDIPVFREVAGNGAFFFNGLSAMDLTNAIQEWQRLLDAKIAPTSSNVHRLSWGDSAKNLLQSIGIS